jgi:Leu/Phe-tRNA-protein transferase
MENLSLGGHLKNGFVSDELVVSKSIQTYTEQNIFTVTFNKILERAISRYGRMDKWDMVTNDMIEAYGNLGIQIN